jgi:hypothetical protein
LTGNRDHVQREDAVFVIYAGEQGQGSPTFDEHYDVFVVPSTALRCPPKYFKNSMVAIKTSGKVLLPMTVHSVRFDKVYRYQIQSDDGPELTEGELEEIVNHVVSY